MKRFTDPRIPGYVFNVASGYEFEKHELLQIETIVRSRGEVDGRELHRYLPAAVRIAVARIADAIVAAAVLKAVRPDHNQTVAAKSVDGRLQGDDLEFGYAATKSEHEGLGLGGLLASIALEHDGRIYATAIIENDRIRGMLLRRGFAEAGKPWRSYRGNHYLSLWLRR